MPWVTMSSVVDKVFEKGCILWKLECYRYRICAIKSIVLEKCLCLSIVRNFFKCLCHLFLLFRPSAKDFHLWKTSSCPGEAAMTEIPLGMVVLSGTLFAWFSAAYSYFLISVLYLSRSGLHTCLVRFSSNMVYIYHGQTRATLDEHYSNIIPLASRVSMCFVVWIVWQGLHMPLLEDFLGKCLHLSRPWITVIRVLSPCLLCLTEQLHWK